MPYRIGNSIFLRLITTLFLPCLLVSCGGGGSGVDAPAALPIEVWYVSPDNTRFVISTELGSGPAFNALLDTGSSGLRFFPDVTSSTTPYVIEGSTFTEAFGGPAGFDVVASGQIVQTTVQAAGYSTGSVLAGRIDSYTCTSAFPKCGANEISSTFGPGLRAIMGVGMRAGLGSPLAALASSGDVEIRAPSFGNVSGSVVLNPNDLDRFSFVRLAAQHPPSSSGSAGWDDFIPMCMSINGGSPICTKSGLADTGGQRARVVMPGGKGKLPPGTQVRFWIGTETNVIISTDFVVSSSPAAGRDLIDAVDPSQSKKPADVLSPGCLPFFYFDIVLDYLNGRIGFSAKAQSG